MDGTTGLGRRVVAGLLAWTAVLLGLRGIVALPERCRDTSVAELEAHAAAAVGWMDRNQEPDGTWAYEYDAEADELSSAYNIVRHAGLIMALYQAAAAGVPRALDVADAGTAWAMDRLVPTGEDAVALAITGRRVDAGASALLVAGLIERREMTGDTTFDGQLARMGRFLAGQVTEDGALLAFFDPSTGEPVPDEFSRYYTGEAFWALARLHTAFPDAGWEDPAGRVADYLATRRDDAEGYSPPIRDHWAAYGLAEMARWPVGVDGITADEIRYARLLARLLGAHVRSESQITGEGIASVVRPEGSRGAALGTTGEGLGALWRLAMADPRLRDVRRDIGDRVVCAATILADRQVTAAEAEAFPRPDLVAGAWFREGETRMDDQQHSLSALLAAIEVLVGEPGARGLA